jgi:hypothetical protein
MKLNLKLKYLLIIISFSCFFISCAHQNPDVKFTKYISGIEESSIANAPAEEQLNNLKVEADKLLLKLNEVEKKEEKEAILSELGKIYEKMGYIKGKTSIKQVYKEQADKISKLLEEEPYPLKMPDTIVRIMFMPYVDEDKVLHAQSYKFLKLDEGKWVIGEYLLKPGEAIREVTPLEQKQLNNQETYPLSK